MDFRYAKRNRQIDHWLVIALSACLFLGLNFLASKTDLQIDLTPDNRYSLSKESLLLLEKVDQPIDIIITLPSSNNLPKVVQRLVHDIDLLLDSMERVESSHPIRVHRVDVNSPKQTSEILDIYKISEPNLIVVGSPKAGKRIIYRYNETSSTNPYDTSQVFRSAESIARQSIWEAGFYSEWKELGNGRLEPGSFRGEETLVRNILQLSNTYQKRKVAYFTRGHGEYSPTDTSPDTGLSDFRSLLEDRNLDVASIDLSTIERIPMDAKILVIAGPKGIFQEKEISIIRNFMNQSGGSVLLALDPVEELTLTDRPALGLRTLLKEWGIRCHDMLIHDPNKENFDLFTGAYFLRTYPKGENHRLISNLAQEGFSILADRCRPVEVNRQDGQSFITRELLFSSRDSWALSSWTERSFPPDKNPLLDLAGPVPILAISSPNPVHLEVSNLHKNGKLAVLGCSRILSNKKMKSAAGNQTLSRNLIYWLQNESEMLTVTPRKLHTYFVTMNHKEFETTLYYFTIIPASILIVGLFVGWLRKEL